VARPNHPAPSNRLLAALPAEDFARLRPRMEPFELTHRQTVFAPTEPITNVIFPETGWFSCLIAVDDGDASEVGLIGREGMAGMPLLFGDDRSPSELMVQAPGMALRLGAEAFREALGDSAALRTVLLRYALAFHAQVSQTAACNGRHHVEQRLARWLLMAHDRTTGDSFPMTHEFLSMMLGVRRAGVTVAASALQRVGLIRYERGIIEVTDRPGLEIAVCDCYDVVRREFERLLGPAVWR
jgi:CRP-like cAMP-binding protein